MASFVGVSGVDVLVCYEERFLQHIVFACVLCLVVANGHTSQNIEVSLGPFHYAEGNTSGGAIVFKEVDRCAARPMLLCSSRPSKASRFI